MTKEELKGIKIWLGEDPEIARKIILEIAQYSANFPQWKVDINCTAKYIYTEENSNHTMWDSGANHRAGFNKLSLKEITPAQLFGEPEIWEPKVGEWVVLTEEYSNSGLVAGKSYQILRRQFADSDWWILRHFEDAEKCFWAPNKNILRPALPREIPQQEEKAEYVECIKASVGGYEVGKIYKVENYNKEKEVLKLVGHTKACISINLTSQKASNSTDFKPSTREAYEAQERKYKVTNLEYVECEDCGGDGKTLKAVLLPSGHSEQTIDCPTCNGQGEVIKKVNQVSQLKTNKNGTEKSSEVNDSMDPDTRGTRGQEIRLRTKSLRVICESGSAQVGREVSKTRGGRKRTKAEIGERFV